MPSLLKAPEVVSLEKGGRTYVCQRVHHRRRSGKGNRSVVRATLCATGEDVFYSRLAAASAGSVAAYETRISPHCGGSRSYVARSIGSPSEFSKGIKHKAQFTSRINFLAVRCTLSLSHTTIR